MSASLFVRGACGDRGSNPPEAVTRLLDGRHHLERFAMEQAGEVDYLITRRDNEFVGRVSLTPCCRAGANRRWSAFLKSPSCLRLCLHLPALMSTKRGPMACSNAHAMLRRQCTSPGFNLARTTLRWVASRRCQTETRSSAGSAARNPPVSSVVSRRSSRDDLHDPLPNLAWRASP